MTTSLLKPPFSLILERDLACDSAPCENGGECIDDMDSDSGEDIYTCNCVDYTGGVTCTDSKFNRIVSDKF